MLLCLFLSPNNQSSHLRKTSINQIINQLTPTHDAQWEVSLIFQSIILLKEKTFSHRPTIKSEARENEESISTQSLNQMFLWKERFLWSWQQKLPFSESGHYCFNNCISSFIFHIQKCTFLQQHRDLLRFILFDKCKYYNDMSGLEQCKYPSSGTRGCKWHSAFNTGWERCFITSAPIYWNLSSNVNVRFCIISTNEKNYFPNKMNTFSR